MLTKKNMITKPRKTKKNAENMLKPYYNSIKLKKLFDTYPKGIDGLKFGFICPGAMKTVDYLNKHKNKSNQKTIKRIKELTDFLFFIEIIVIYKNHIIKNKSYYDSKKIIGNNACKLSNKTTASITKLFGKLKADIKNNIPDNFYHIRHNTLICSDDEKLSEKRIKLLKTLYN